MPLWRRTSTRGIAYHEHLYTKIAASGESDEVERWLGAEFEAPAEEAIEKAVSDKRLTPADWRLLARFSPFALVNGVLTANSDPLRVRPRR